jgi:hypothetical protein
MKRNIPWNQLSKTFQDAITITRKLGIQYIWIDSLCIVQDDKEDWRAESSKMDSVYGNSYLTINASYAKDGSEGCLCHTKALETPGTRIPLSDGDLSLPCIYVDVPFPHLEVWGYDVTERSSLDHRAWALQERLLSPRTLHCTSSELVWECYCSIRCQCNLVNLLEGGRRKVLSLKQMWYQAIVKRDTRISLSKMWESVVEEYSSRHLTWDADRLVALSGLTTKFRELGAARYLAGMWQPTLHKEMLWRVGYTDKPEYDIRSRLYRVPSWSWASMRGCCFFPPSFEYHRGRRFMSRIISEQMTGTEDDEEVLLSNVCTRDGGKDVVSGGYLTIAGKHVEARVIKFDERDSLLYVQINGSSKAFAFFQDDESETSNGDRLTCVLWSVVPDRRRPMSSNDIWDYSWLSYALVLSRSSISALYKRVGIACLTWSFVGWEENICFHIFGRDFNEHESYDLIYSSELATAKELFRSSSMEIFEVH